MRRRTMINFRFRGANYSSAIYFESWFRTVHNADLGLNGA